ncbi:ABC transporter permease [Fluviicola taffensis]|uniref:ABC transporter permease n=1 Tax=Fluviicola taffensis TaxID=191579 RepID=UPI00313838F4
MYFRIRMSNNWNYIYFIAKKLQRKQAVTDDSLQGNKKAAKPITRIAILSISLAMVVNIVTIAVVEGFQQEVSRKVIGFGSHISIQKSGEISLMESSPLMKSEKFEQTLSRVEGVTHVQSVAYKPALLQSRGGVTQKEILGVVLKGVDKNYDWSFFKSYLKEGELPTFKDPSSTEVLISKRIASDLHYKLGDTINAYFVKQKPIQRQFQIVGIYETGLEDFDKELVFCYLPQVQQLNDWGIVAEITVDDTLADGELVIRAQVSGGNGNYRYDWGKGYERYAGFTICPTKDTIIKLVASDYWTFLDEPSGSLEHAKSETAIPDTAYLEIKVHGNKPAPCVFKLDPEGNLKKKFLSQDGLHYELDAGAKKVELESFPGHGSYREYIGSYELSVADFSDIKNQKYKIKKAVEFNPDFRQQVKVNSIKDNQADLFVWLSFLDVNLAIVLILMLIIGIVNMGSALLVLILVRTNFIGILKAMGASNLFVRKVFLVHTGQLILKGMIWGNVIGIGLCWLQYQFHIIPLDAKVYYLNTVPIEFNIWKIALLNIITLSVCLAVLFVPSLLISRINPAKSIRFK